MTPVLRPERTVPVDHATGRLRLVLAPRPTPGGVDGRWWPRTRDLAVELPALIAAVAQRFGAVDRVSLDPEAWYHRPRRATVGGRSVVLDRSGGGGRHAVDDRRNQSLPSRTSGPTPATGPDAAGTRTDDRWAEPAGSARAIVSRRVGCTGWLQVGVRRREHHRHVLVLQPLHPEGR